MSPKTDFISTIGRRKEATARIRLTSGKGEDLINGKPALQIFPGVISKEALNKPFMACEVKDKYHFSAVVEGGGTASQLEAIVLGVSRALAVANPDFKPKLRQHDLLTRDPRERQRRMVGMGGKSRRKKQSPKR